MDPESGNRQVWDACWQLSIKDRENVTSRWLDLNLSDSPRGIDGDMVLGSSAAPSGIGIFPPAPSVLFPFQGQGSEI